MNLQEKLKHFTNKGWKYNPETGEIYSHTGYKIKSKHQGGYISCGLRLGNKIITVDGHQLAWYLYYNEVPIGEIDHIDRDRNNTKINNLRIGTKSQNHYNESNVKGCSYNKQSNRWVAYIQANKKFKHLGSFKTEKEAHECYLKNKQLYHIFNNKQKKILELC